MTPPQRKSRQRAIILEELRKMHSHPTAADLFEIVRQRVPRISLGTVYRNLDQLAEAGEIRRLPASGGGGGQARFDGDLDSHHHVRCVDCGRVADVHGATNPPSTSGVASPDGFMILGCRIEFTGRCPACSAQLAGQDALSGPDTSNE